MYTARSSVHDPLRWKDVLADGSVAGGVAASMDERCCTLKLRDVSRSIIGGKVIHAYCSYETNELQMRQQVE